MIERAVEVFMTTANQTTPREMMALRTELKRVLDAPEPPPLVIDSAVDVPDDEGHIE